MLDIFINIDFKILAAILIAIFYLLTWLFTKSCIRAFKYLCIPTIIFGILAIVGALFIQFILSMANMEALLSSISNVFVKDILYDGIFVTAIGIIFLILHLVLKKINTNKHPDTPQQQTN